MVTNCGTSTLVNGMVLDSFKLSCYHMDMREIQLVHSKRTFKVSDEDFNKCNQYYWYLNRAKGRVPYITTEINGKPTRLGRFILGYDGELQVDHKDRDSYNNQRENLRLVTSQQQNRNKGVRKDNITRYKGVKAHQGKFVSRIIIDGKERYLGIYDTPEEAAERYNRAAKKYFGEFAYLNVIKEQE